MGKRNGALSGVHPVDLSGHVLRALADRSGIDPGGGGRRDLGLRRPGRASRRSTSAAHAVLAAGWPRRRARHDGGPAVRFLAAVGPLRRRRPDRRPVRRGGGGRRGVDEPGADGDVPDRRANPARLGHRRLGGAASGRTRAIGAEMIARALGSFPRPAGRVLAGLAREGGGGAGRRPVRRSDRAGHARPTAPSSSPTRASAGAARSSRWPSSSRPSRPTASCTPATARRSPTAWLHREQTPPCKKYGLQKRVREMIRGRRRPAGVDPVIMLTGVHPGDEEDPGQERPRHQRTSTCRNQQAFASVPPAWQADLGVDPARSTRAAARSPSATRSAVPGRA